MTATSSLVLALSKDSANALKPTPSILLLEADDRQGAGTQTHEPRLMDECLLPTVRYPDLGCADVSERDDQLIPIRMIGDYQGQLDATRLGPLAHPHPPRCHANNDIGELSRPTVVGCAGRRQDDTAL